MGMTIDEARLHLDTWSTTHGSGITTDEQHEQAKKIARDIMRKYQKIEEIVNDRHGKSVFKALDEVIKVVEDGNDD